MYSPGYGWIPFEPTKTRSLPIQTSTTNKNWALLIGDRKLAAPECFAWVSICQDPGCCHDEAVPPAAVSKLPFWVRSGPYLVAGSADVCAVIRELKRNPETRHIPVIAFTDLKNEELQSAATTAGATMVAGNDAILDQLPELLEQALQVE